MSTGRSLMLNSAIIRFRGKLTFNVVVYILDNLWFQTISSWSVEEYHTMILFVNLLFIIYASKKTCFKRCRQGVYIYIYTPCLHLLKQVFLEA